MTTKETGGPAFPNQVKITDEGFAELRGMTLRDYFSAKALQGLLSRQGLTGKDSEYAAISYRAADAMLKARNA